MSTPPLMNPFAREPGDFEPTVKPGMYYQCFECDHLTPKTEWDESRSGNCAACQEVGDDDHVGQDVRIVAITSEDDRKRDDYAGRVNARIIEEGDEGFAE